MTFDQIAVEILKLGIAGSLGFYALYIVFYLVTKTIPELQKEQLNSYKELTTHQLSIQTAAHKIISDSMVTFSSKVDEQAEKVEHLTERLDKNTNELGGLQRVITECMSQMRQQASKQQPPHV